MKNKRTIRSYEQGSGKLIEERIEDLSEEELEEESQVEEIESIQAILDDNWTPAQVAERLKVVIRRLINKGILP